MTKQRDLGQRLVPLLLALMIALPAFVAPLAAGPDAVAGHRQSDVYTALWDIDYVADSLADGHLPLRTNRIAFPRGGLLFPSKPIVAAIAAPLRAVFGLNAAYNITVWLLLAVGFLGAFRLAERLTGSRVGGLVAGVGFGLSPFMTCYATASGATEILGLGFLPWALLYLERVADGPSRGGVVGLAVSLALTLISGAYVAVLAAVALAVWLVLLPFRRKKTTGVSLDRAGWLRVAFGLLGGALLASPFLFALAWTLRSADSMLAATGFAAIRPAPPWVDFAPGASSYYAAGLLDYWRPHVARIAEGSLFAKTVTLTFGITILALAGVIYRARQVMGWVIAALLLMVLSTGPYLLLTAKVGLPWPANPVYLAGYYLVPPLRWFLEPFRFGQAAMLFAALAAAAGAAALVEKFGRRGGFVGGLCVLAALVEIALLAAPFWRADDLARAPSSEEVTQAARQSAGAVVELPFFDPENPDLLRRDRFANQVWHGRPIVDSITGFLPPFVTRNGLLARLAKLENAGVEVDVRQTAAQGAQDLRAAGVAALVVDVCAYRHMRPEAVNTVRRLLEEGGVVADDVTVIGECTNLVRLSH